MENKIYDGESVVFGRISTIIAKELLKGNSVKLINCEKIIFSGDKKKYVEKLNSKRKMGRGASMKGPKYIRKEDLLLKRMIRGMLPWDRAKGREAFKKLRCYIGLGELSKEETQKAIKIKSQKPLKSFTTKELIKGLK